MADPLDYENGLMLRKISEALTRASNQYHAPQKELMDLMSQQRMRSLPLGGKSAAMGEPSFPGQAAAASGAYDHLQNLKEQRIEAIRAQMANAKKDMDAMVRLKYGLKD